MGDRPQARLPAGRSDRPSSEPACRQVLLAGDVTGTVSSLGPALAAVGARVRQVRSGAELERVLGREGPFDLVVSAAQLPDKTGLCVLADARATGITAPFVVVVAAYYPRLRVLVSQTGGNVLSSRMLDQNNLVALAREMMRPEGMAD